MVNMRILIRSTPPNRSLLFAITGIAVGLASAQPPTPTPARIQLDSGATVRIWDATPQDPTDALQYQFLEPDGTASAPAAQVTELRLKNGQFDPLQTPSPSRMGLVAPADSELWIVQFQTSPRAEYHELLKAFGAEVMPGHIRGQARVVRMPRSVRDRVAMQPWVRWVGHVQPEMKLDPAIGLDRLSETETIEIQIKVEPPSRDAQSRLVDTVLDAGGSVLRAKESGTSLVCKANASLIRELLWSDDCYFVSPFVEAVESSADSRVAAKAVYNASNLGPYMGDGVRIATNDSNYQTDSELMVGNANHPGLVNQPIIRYNPPFDPQLNNKHGVGTYSVLYAPVDHPDFPEVQGAVSLGQGIFNSLFSFQTNGSYALSLDRDCVTLPLVTTATDPVLSPPASASYRAVAESNSWNTGISLVYNSEAIEVDTIAFQYQHMIVHGTGNDSAGIGLESGAKNIITAGPLDINGDPTDKSLHSSIPSQGNGPVDVDSITGQGRVKPDLIAPSILVWVAGVGSLDPNLPMPQDIRQAPGVSYSTPSIAGCAGLVYEMWGKEHASGSGDNIFRRAISSTTGNPDTDVFANRPAPSVVKALLINTADPYDWNQDTNNDGIIDSASMTPNNSLNRGEQGWGRPDLEKLYTRAVWYQDSNMVTSQCQLTAPGAIAPVMFVNPELNSLTTQGQTYTRCFEVTPTDTELRVTLVWSDPPPSMYSGGNPLVNDLDLEVTAPDGTTIYRGNYGLVDQTTVPNPGIWSTSGGSADVTNNVENIFIPADDLQTGLYEIKVTLSNLNADGNLPQWTNCSPSPLPITDGTDDTKFTLVVTRGPCVADFNQDGVVDNDDKQDHATALSNSNPRADVNFDGVINFFDIIDFATIHAGGCP